MDAFTLNLLTNDEVLAVNQDPLGNQATMVYNGVRYQIWTKDLADGSKAVGVFNIGKEGPVEAFNWTDGPQMLKITVGANQIGLDDGGEYRIRDLWRQQDIGTFNNAFGFEVPLHGVRLLKISPVE